jgi:outer membrane lipoprotein-sorting protein
MRFNTGKTLFWFGLLLITVSFTSSSIERIMMKMKSQNLNNGRVMTTEAELFYNAVSGQLVTRYTNPPGQVLMVNSKGELSIYNENDNSVIYRQGIEYNSHSTVIQYFLLGKTHDLGLSEMGFQLRSTSIENNKVITEWFPPANMGGAFEKVKLVHENFLPIYAAYYDIRKNVAKKTYYSEYQMIGDAFFPSLITEFNYIGNDSLINRIRFSDIKINRQANSQWFSFKVPSDAKLKR